MEGWANLGAAFGGDSEKSYQEGLALGAKTEDALAAARERVEKNAARARMAQELRNTGLDENTANAASTALTAGASLTDPIQLMLKNQEFGFRAKAGDPNVALDEGNRALMGVASGPVEPIYRVGKRAFNKFDTPENIEDLGAVFGDSGGGSSAFMQAAEAFGLLNPDGSISPENRALAYEILRNTDKLFDKGGVPEIYTGNPYGRAGGAAQPAAQAPGAPPQGAQAAGPTAAASAPAAVAPAAVSAPLASVDEVARNKGMIAAATEQGQAQGRNAAVLQSSLNKIDEFETTLDQLAASPGFASIYGNLQGPGSTFTQFMSSDIADARAFRNLLQNKAFGVSIQQMRGLGQLSNMEGLKVQDALTLLTQPNISDEAARQAVQSLKTHLAELRRVAAIEAGQGSAPGASAPADAGGWQTINGVRIRVKPQ